MVPGRIIRSCAILLAFGCAFITTAQIREIAPARVIDMRTVTPGLLGETCTAIQAVATVGRRWAALLTCPGNQSVVVWGDLKDMHTAVLQGRFTRMAMDAAYNIALTSYPVAALASAGVTKVTVLDSDGHLSKNLKLTRLDVRPLMVGGEIRWATDAGVFKDEELSAVSSSAARISGAPSVAPPTADHILYYGAARRVTDCFTSACPKGQSPVRLSIAGVNPLTGEVKDVIRASLPTTPMRILPQFNLAGVIDPVLGSVDEQVIIADPRPQIIVVD